MSTPAFMLSPKANIVEAGNWSSPPVWASTIGRPRCRSSSTVAAGGGRGAAVVVLVVVGTVDVVAGAVVGSVVASPIVDGAALEQAARAPRQRRDGPARPTLLSTRAMLAAGGVLRWREVATAAPNRASPRSLTRSFVSRPRSSGDRASVS